MAERSGSRSPSPSASAALEAKEAELTREVPNLLDAMNRTSDEVNLFERQTTEAQERYRKMLEKWMRLYEDLRAQYGSAIDRVKPLFDAEQVLHAASKRVQNVTREAVASNSQHSQAKVELRTIETRLAYGAHKVQLDRDQQDGLSRATVRVLKCQQEKDRRDTEYKEALRCFKEAKQNYEGWKLQIGESVIKCYMPCFRNIRAHQDTLAEEKVNIDTWSERAQAAKSVYNNSLCELDRINVAVHSARRAFAKLPVEADSRSLPEEDPEAAPEVTVAHSPEAVFAAPEDKVTNKSKVSSATKAAFREEDDGPFS